MLECYALSCWNKNRSFFFTGYRFSSTRSILCGNHTELQNS